MMKPVFGLASLALVCLSIQTSGQVPLSFPGLAELPQLKDFKALRSSSNNSDPDSNDDSKRPIPGETVVIADLQGPGQVNHIWLTIAANEYGWPRLLRLRIYYDGSPTPSVDVPVGDFFGVGHGLERPINSLLVRNSSGGRSRNCYWPMPFRRSCKITVTNEGRRRVSNLYYHVDWQKMESLPPAIGYFHALYKQALPAPLGKPYEILSIQGRGHYVGTVFSVIQSQPGWFGEGDDLFYVDGEQRPSIEGTGSEDYFNDAWSLRVAEGPYTGVPIAEGTNRGARMTAYRWHLTDPIPFMTSFRFDIEHAGWTYNADGTVRSGFEERPDLFSTVAFWYQQGVAGGLPEPPYGAARLPHGNARQIEAESLLQDVKVEGGQVEIQKEVFWSRDLLFFKAQGTGSRVDLPLDVEEDGQYELLAQVAHAPDYGNYLVTLDGKPVFEDTDLEHEPGANTGAIGQIDLYNFEVYVAEDHVLGWHQLKKGRHAVSFSCSGKSNEATGYNLGIDTLILAKVGAQAAMGGARAAEIRAIGALGQAGPSQIGALYKALSDPDPMVREAAAWAFTQFGEGASVAVNQLGKALIDPDPVVRGLAAIGLRNSGTASLPLLGPLIGKLKDEDPNVRMMTAQTIERQGKLAVAAVPALIEACQVEGEHVHVLRSLVSALGAIGPEASPALPVLKKLQAHPRVRWSANAAIRNITGGPVVGRAPPTGKF
jgi:hypothetical protein